MNKLDLKRIIPFIPLLVVFVILIIKPYYLFPTVGDTNYHLMRALEILQDPLVAFIGITLFIHQKEEQYGIRPYSALFMQYSGI